MIERNILGTLLIMGSTLVSSGTHAQDNFMEFSAEAFQQSPQRPLIQAKMYVSKNAVRTDYQMNNSQRIDIVYRKQHKRVTLFPQQKTYTEQLGVPTSSESFKQNRSTNPCEGVPDVVCKKVADENINGVIAEKWEFTSNVAGKEIRTLHWIDKQRRFPVKQYYPDGTLSELRKLASESIDSRVTEKWQLIITRPNGARLESFQWYDPELKMAIREEIPGGYVRELRNIKLGKQKSSLFDIPSDYQKVQATK